MRKIGIASELLVLFLVILIGTIGASTLLLKEGETPNGLFHKRIRVKLPICGNGIIERTEQCEPPSTAACDSWCHKITAPATECLDSDGNDPFLAGTLTFEPEKLVIADRCVDPTGNPVDRSNTLQEFYCTEGTVDGIAGQRRASEAIGCICMSGICLPSCSDGMKNQNETDIDCGGICVIEGKRCSEGKACRIANDCASRICKADSCIREKPPASELPSWLKVCESNCDALPVPVLKVCPKDNVNCVPKTEATIEFSLDGKPLLTFITLFRLVQEDRVMPENYRLVIEDAKGVLQLDESGPLIAKMRSNGASKIEILFDPVQIDGKSLFLDMLLAKWTLVRPGEMKNIPYRLNVDDSPLGVIQFYSTTDSQYDVQAIFSHVKEVTQKIDQATAKQHVPYWAYIMPPPLSLLLGGEGNFYQGQGKITMTYNDELTVDCKGMCAVLRGVVMAISHEYTHAIQSERGPQSPQDDKLPSDSCFFEGMADALTVYLGYNEPQKLIDATTYDEGCPKSIMQINNMPHNFGRCIFGHLMQANVFSGYFFKRLFNPEMKYTFQDACDVSIAQTCQTYKELFNWASGQDVTVIIKEKIKGNC